MLERTVVKSCSFHELNEAVGKQTDPGASEHFPGLQHHLGFSVYSVLDMERAKLPRRAKTAKNSPPFFLGSSRGIKWGRLQGMDIKDLRSLQNIQRQK